MSQVDVLVVAVLPLEFESAVSAPGDAVARAEVSRRSAVPYVSTEIDTPGGRLSIALDPHRRGGRNAAPLDGWPARPGPIIDLGAPITDVLPLSDGSVAVATGRGAILLDLPAP